MSDKSDIEWTDATWNPVRGCTKISPGCKHCYAETFAERWRGIAGHPYEQGFDLRLVPDKLEEPIKWRKPSRVFVNSMSDLFHEDVPDEYIDRVFAIMQYCLIHTFQVLTKRADRLAAYMNGNVRQRVKEAGQRLAAQKEWCHANEDEPWPLRNVWLGVSVEDQERADERIPHLLQTPAAIRFLSCEPLLGPVDIRFGLAGWKATAMSAIQRIDWCIIGGESGAGARPMQLDWARSLVEQCKAAGVATFVKQLGGFPEGGDVVRIRGRTVVDGRWMRDKKGGDMQEWPPDLRIREFPEVRRAD